MDYLTFSDVAAATNNNQLVPVVDEVSTKVTMFNDAPWKATSDMLRDIGGREGDPPRGTWVGVDEGAKPNKGSMEKYVEELGMIESWSKTIKKIADISPHSDEMRWREDRRHLKGLGLDLESALIYGNRSQNIRKFDGFIPRFKTLTDIDGMGLVSGEDEKFITIDAGGTNNDGMSSIMLVYWDIDEGAHLLYPSHSKDNGMQFVPYGFKAVEQSDGTLLEVAYSKFACTVGLGIANRKSVIRIANIDNSLSGSDLKTAMGKIEAAIYDAFAAVPVDFQSKIRLYANNRTLSTLRKGFSGRIYPANYGDSVPKNAIGDVMFDSFNIRRCDSLISTEEKVV